MSTRPADRDDPPAVDGDVRPKHLPLIGTQRSGTPPVIPARMLNEVMYCERLMYLEWVHGEFRDNYYTVDGRAAHEHADSPGGSLPDPAPSDEEVDDASVDKPYTARSVWLTSESLGITAKIDIVEGQGDGHVVPVEYKRGRPPNVPERAYLPERVQLCAQVLLLREHGYSCDHGEIYFVGSKQRIPVQIGPDLIAHTQWAVRVGQEVASRSEPPKPLQELHVSSRSSLTKRLPVVPTVELVSRAKRRYGGYTVHLGLVAMYFGFTGASYDTEKEAALRHRPALPALPQSHEPQVVSHERKSSHACPRAWENLATFKAKPRPEARACQRRGLESHLCRRRAMSYEDGLDGQATLLPARDTTAT